MNAFDGRKATATLEATRRSLETGNSEKVFEPSAEITAAFGRD